MPAIEPGKIRNVAVVGHRGTGKTSLVEAMLFQAGAVNRLGTSSRDRPSPTGTTTSSGGRCRSPASLCHVDWQGRKINLIDTPGDAGFQGDAIAALRVVEGALFVVSGVMGVEVGTGRVWKRAEERELSRVRLREHARPRARRLLPHARGAPRAALGPLRRRPPPDRRRARADRDRRPAAHVRLHEPGRRARGRRRADPGRAGRAGRRVPREAARRASSRPTRR